MTIYDSATVNLTRDLVRHPSVTPDDYGCQDILAERLKLIGFSEQRLRFGDVDNLWARRGDQSPLFVFAGHTDVVPPGPEDRWTYPPFAAEIVDGHLYGRGTADMKGSLAAMVTACERFIKRNPKHTGSIAFLITSDEEGDAVNGTKKVVEWLQQQKQSVDFCVVGEPSSQYVLGDIIRIGRRGSLTGNLRVHGKQGHVAYPERADNPIHRCGPFIHELCNRQWDNGNGDFPPTSFQISNINGGTGVGNVIPGHLDILFNFRFSPELNATNLQHYVEALCYQHGLDFDIEWMLFGNPFYTAQGELVNAVSSAIKDINKVDAVGSTGGGTSDGRFIATTGAQVIELGPINHSIHEIDEHVNLADLDTLSEIYESILVKLLT